MSSPLILPDANPQPPPPVEATAVRSAFTVVIDREGGVSVDTSLAKGLVLDREPTNEDILGAVAVIEMQINTGIAAMKTAQIMMQQAQAMQQQISAQAQVADIQKRLHRNS